MLGTLPARKPAAGPEGRDHHLALAGMAPDIADRLAELHRRIERADLPLTMIHGDYGIHNLLFRRDDVAVVTDFELARRELRLIDLVIVLSRVATEHGAAFLDGYREQTSIADEEWAQLANVWQYYRLTGAIQSWRNHSTHGGDGRLATARRRVAEAEWAATQVAPRWM
jgi:Ser/Thr protein kinase RdoA (MazF antagonist)